MPDGSKRAANLTLSKSLLAEAKALGLNISRAAERGLALAIDEKRAEQWLVENRAALDSSNEYVETHGLPLANHRQF